MARADVSGRGNGGGRNPARPSAPRADRGAGLLSPAGGHGAARPPDSEALVALRGDALESHDGGIAAADHPGRDGVERPPTRASLASGPAPRPRSPYRLKQDLDRQPIPSARFSGIAPTQWRCPKCGSLLEADGGFRHCRMCGKLWPVEGVLVEPQFLSELAAGFITVQPLRRT